MVRDIHGVKRGRNEPCWCGSGLKYKRCHFDRANQPPSPTSEVFKKFRKSSDLRSCSCPPSWKHECSGEIVRAHSLSKRQALGAVTENGHVFSPIPDPQRLFHYDDFKGRLIGVNKASTFTGFCGKHDQAIFRELDTEEFDGKASQTFLVAYRTLCRELFAKQGHVNSFGLIRELDKGRSVADQIFVQQTSLYGSVGARAALAELNVLKDQFDDSLLNTSYTRFSFKNFYFKDGPNFVSAGGFNPTHNLNGCLIQDLSRMDQTSENLFFSILPAKLGFWVSFLWPTEYGLMKTFVDDFERIATVGTAYGVALGFVENTFLKPSTWTRFTLEEKSVITRLTFMGVANDDYSGLPNALAFLANQYPGKPAKIVSA